MQNLPKNYNMNKRKYLEYMNEAIIAAPILKDILITILKKCEYRNTIPKSITICENIPNVFSDLLRLFPSEAIKEQKGKYIIIPQKIAKQNDLEQWLSGAAKVANFSYTKNDLAKDQFLIERLRFQFPQLDAAVDYLSKTTSTVKRRITQDGYDKAIIFYKHALMAVDFLKNNNIQLSLSDLGVRITSNSKSLRRETALFKTTLKLLSSELSCSEDEVMTICGVADNPTSISVTIFGPFVYKVHEERFDWIKRLWEHGEAVTLNYTNIKNMDKIIVESDFCSNIISCENESPFNAMMRKNPKSVLIYTSGFPNTAVKRFISLLEGDFSLFHWGDTDPEGFLIASTLNKIKPLKLFRCDIEECKRLKLYLRDLDQKKQTKAKKLLQSKDFAFTSELSFSLHNGWLEQEAWKEA